MKLWIVSALLCLLTFLGYAEGLDLFPLPSAPKRCATPNCIGLNCITKPGSDGCPVCVCEPNCPEIVCGEGCFLEAPPPSGKCPGCVCNAPENPLSSLSNDQLETAQSNLLQTLQRNVSSLAESVTELRRRVNEQEQELQHQRKALHRLRDIHKHAQGGHHHHHHHQHGNNTEGLLGRTHHLHEEHHSENNTGNSTDHHHHHHHHRHHGHHHHHEGHESENTTNHDSHHHDGHHHHDHVGNITGHLGHVHNNNLTETLHPHHDEEHHHDKHDGEHHNHHGESEENNSHENSAEDHHGHHDDHNDHHDHHPEHHADNHHEHHADHHPEHHADHHHEHHAGHHQEHHDDHHQQHHDDHHHDHHHHHHDQGLHIPQLSETEYDFATCEIQPNTALPAEQQQNIQGRINLWQQKGGKTLHVHVRLHGFNVAGHAHEGHENHESSKEAEDAPKAAAASPLLNLGKHVRQGFQSLASNAKQGFPKAEPGQQLPDSHDGHHHHHHLQSIQERVQERLDQAPKQLPASGDISSLHPSGEGHVHGFHVHTNGDLSDGCQTTGPHFNPTEKNHGGRNSSVRHVGDFGNIPCDSLGVTNVIFTDEIASLTGEQSIIGRSLVIHANQDDLGTNADDPESLATGNSGPRIACCVIERVNRLPHFSVRTARRILREIMHPFSAIESE